MRARDVRIVFRKEIVDLLRDRRSVLATIVFPILFFPVFMFASERVAELRKDELGDEGFTVVFAGDWPELAARIGGIDGVRVVADDNPRSAIREDRADAAVEVMPPSEVPGEDLPLVVLVFDRSRDVSRVAGDRLREEIGLFREQERAGELALLGLAHAEEEILDLRENNLASEEKMAGGMLGGIFPILLVFLLLNGASFAAVDLFSGEKERKTIETLLTSLVDRRSLVGGKYLTVFTVAITSVLLFLASCYLSTRLGISGGAAVEAGLALSPARALIVLLLVLPLATLVSALVVLVSSHARTYREAQTLLMPLLLVMLLPAGLAASSGVGIDSVAAIVPIANVALAVREALVGNYPWIPLLVVLASNGIYAAFILRRAVSYLESEAVVMGGAGDGEFRPAGEKTLGREISFFYVFQILMLYYVGSAIQARSLLPGLIITLWGIVLVPTLLFIRRYGLSWTESLQLRRCRPGHLLGAALLAPATLVLADGLFQLQSRLVPVPSQLFEEMGQLVSLESGFALLFFAVALSPAVCEELFFRGLILGRHRKSLPAWKAVLLGGFLFGLFHLSIYRLLPTGALGVVAGTLVVRSGSIFPAMVLHAVYNGLVVSAHRFEAFEEVDSLGPEWIAGFAVAALVGIALLRLPRKDGTEGETAGAA